MRRGRSFLKGIVGLFLLGAVLPPPAASIRTGPPAAAVYELTNLTKKARSFALSPAIAIDAAKKVHVAWYGFVLCAASPEGVASHVYYTNNVAGSFARPVQIAIAPSYENGWYSKHPSLAVDAKGYAHIAFVRSTSQTSVQNMDDIYYATNAPQAGAAAVRARPAGIAPFRKPVCIVEGCWYSTKAGDVEGPYQPRLHRDGRGGLHLTFMAKQFGTSSDMHVLYKINRGAGWGTPAAVGHGFFIMQHRSAIDARGGVHIVHDFIGSWGQDAELVYVKSAGSGFTAPVRVHPARDDFLYPWDIEVDRNGKAHVVYDSIGGVYYAHNASGGFGGRIKIDRSADPCDIEIDGYGGIHVGYRFGYLSFGVKKGGAFSFEEYQPPDLAEFPDLCMALGGPKDYYFVFEQWRGTSSSPTGCDVYLLKSTVK